jgi:hypothetical protein
VFLSVSKYCPRVGKKRKETSKLGSTKSRTGHLVEEDFFDVAIVVEIDGQISQRAVAVNVIIRRCLSLLLFIEQRIRNIWHTVLIVSTVIGYVMSSLGKVSGYLQWQPMGKEDLCLLLIKFRGEFNGDYASLAALAHNTTKDKLISVFEYLLEPMRLGTLAKLGDSLQEVADEEEDEEVEGNSRLNLSDTLSPKAAQALLDNVLRTQRQDARDSQVPGRHLAHTAWSERQEGQKGQGQGAQGVAGRPCSGGLHGLNRPACGLGYLGDHYPHRPLLKVALQRVMPPHPGG